MSFFSFSAVLYGILFLIERLWPVLLLVLIYYLFKKRWQEFKKQRDS